MPHQSRPLVGEITYAFASMESCPRKRRRLLALFWRCIDEWRKSMDASGIQGMAMRSEVPNAIGSESRNVARKKPKRPGSVAT
jgi:hypothetical protein